jgi:hypothetical protein
MTTDLSEIFRSLYKVNEEGNPEVFSHPDAYDDFMGKIGKSTTTKTWAHVSTEADMWSVPKIALLFSEVVLISAAAVRGRMHGTFFQHTKEYEYTLPLELFERIKGKQILPGLFYADKDVLKRWFDEAGSLVDAGQLVYLPERILMVGAPQPSGAINWNAEHLDNTGAWQVMKPYLPAQQNSNSLITVENDTVALPDAANLMGIQIPSMAQFSLSEFRAFLQSEGDTVVTFRAAIRKAINEAANYSPAKAPQNSIRSAITQIRGDVIEPALAQLNIKHENILRTKKLSVGAASASAVTLSLAMLANPTLTAAVALVGGSGLLASMREFEDYKKQLGALRENPWHLLWKLRRELN